MAYSLRLQTGIELARNLVTALRDPTFLPPIYPRLYRAGVPEGSLHATMLSALVLVGNRLGLTPICDAPVFDDLDLALTAEASKRPDAAWLDRNTHGIRCLIEFERYTPRSLAPKARNLLVMGKAAEHSLDLTVLAYWSYEHVPPQELASASSTLAQGFTHTSGASFKRLDCPALVIEMQVMSTAESKVVVGQILPRTVVAAGEEKPYLVADLTM